MKTSAVLEISNGHIQLTPDILQSLNVGPNCILHGLESQNGGMVSLVLSPIPAEKWATVHKLTASTASKVGSWAKVCELLKNKGISILFDFASASSADGELNVTAFVDLNGIESSWTDHMQGLEALEKEIASEMRSQGVDSKSEIFLASPGNDLEPIQLTRLRMLNRYGEMENERDSYPLENRRLNVSGILTAFSSLPLYGMESPTTVLVTTDTEERYMQVVFLPAWLNLYYCKVRLKVQSQRDDFTGLLEAVLESLKQSALNIFSSSTNVESKGRAKDNEDLFEEHVTYSFTLTPPNRLKNSQMANVVSKLDSDLKSIVEARTKELGATLDSVLVDEFHSLLGGRPLVFIATNAKPRMDQQQKNIITRVVIMLRDFGLHPVNIDIATSGPLVEQAKELMDCCPLMISVYLAEHKYATGTQIGSTFREFGPSPWVTFEEAYMISNPVQVVGKQLPRHVIRMWDERVFAPEFLKGNMEHSFNIDDPESIEDCLAAVEGRLRRTLGQQDWQELTTACFQKEEGHDEAKLRRRDILEWLFRGDRRSTPNVTHALVSQEKPAQKGSVK